MSDSAIQWVRPHLKNLQPYKSARSLYINPVALLLDANENPFGKFNRYPDPNQEDLTSQLGKLWEIAPSKILVTHGSDEGLDLLFRLFMEPKSDKLLICPPTYGMYKVLAELHNTPVISVPLDAQFLVDLPKLKAVITEQAPKMLMLTNPNNPTGNLIGNIASVLQVFKGLVIIDEAYMDFCPENSALPLLDSYPNLIITKTLSKAYGLAGLRLGAVIANEDIVNWLRKIKLPYNISDVTMTFALEQLSDSTALLFQQKNIIEERNNLHRQLEQLEIVEKVYPSVTNFLLVAFQNPAEVFDTLLSQNIIVRDRSHEITNCLRITIGTEEENQHLLTALQSINK